MGYPADMKIPVSDTQAYRQFGNSVVVPVVEQIAKAVIATLSRPLNHRADLVLTLRDAGRSLVTKRSAKTVNYKQRTQK